MAGRVAEKVALITGAASGLGLADAKLLAAEGARVVLTDVNEAAGQTAAQAIGASARFLKHDVRSEAEWQAVVESVMATEGRLDILVNNAGVVIMADPETTTLDQFRFAQAVMSEGVFLGCKYAIPAMAKSGGGSIINMSSVASHLGYPIFFAYSAAKGAVRSMTKSVAIHCQDKGYGVRCNSVHPGSIETPMVQNASGRAEALDIPKTGVLPAGVNGHPNDVANLVVFLASDESRFITGAEFVIENGLTIRAM
jgi:3(or 17)beta-hydroxysteroid dehydrogenase